jgi:beta-N-acetylhexosaminidase
MQDDIVPFAVLGQKLPAIMAAHLVFPAVDEKPVGFSAIWLQQILRKELGFKGTILSDDLNMEGANISADYADRVIAAREAGCDFALLCNNRAGVIQALDKVESRHHQVSAEKWRDLCGKGTKLQVSLEEDIRWQTASRLLASINAKQSIGLSS